MRLLHNTETLQKYEIHGLNLENNKTLAIKAKTFLNVNNHLFLKVSFLNQKHLISYNDKASLGLIKMIENVLKINQQMLEIPKFDTILNHKILQEYYTKISHSIEQNISV